ncbi:TMV resistance protein N [Glycine soja]|uniref:TMV resistance protein N n=2 Tax=Glycine soja TaxID=3848 RepID=A0A445KEV4_GLYSO|nr:TMV resistance protein N [Glycine soja]
MKFDSIFQQTNLHSGIIILNFFLLMAETCSGASRYDVFINFRAEDTRYEFIRHLYKALCDKGIRAFIDEVDLQRGDKITKKLKEAIEGSRIAITVFSKNYASSSFCLDELATILGCYREKTLLVIPVFYKVDPSDVRHQRGSYAEGLARLEERFHPNMEKWRTALQEVADLAGQPLKDGAEYEYEFIGKIADDVFDKINKHVPSSSSFTNDVFLSFRGEDTRYSFTGNLRRALHDSGIHTFVDDDELQRGDEITSELEKEIEDSRFFIIFLSQNYASSSFCLNVLAYILECVKRKRLLVLPIFYKVDPSSIGIRFHGGSFGEALANHEMKFKAKMDGLEHNMEKLEKWKMALHETANFSGYHFKQGDGYEYEFITRIVELVSSKIKQDAFHVGDYPVGLESYSEAFNYDVFLSLRGSDTLHGFTGYLYKALRDSGIHTFIDEDLNRGEEITPAIVKAIEESRIAIVVLSINYASSSICLDELATILDCLERKRMLVLPVFYNVDHSQVRLQEGSYGEALVKHEESLKHSMEKLEKWKMALHQVANLSDIKIKHGRAQHTVVEFNYSKTGFMNTVLEGDTTRKCIFYIGQKATMLNMETSTSVVT